jgi:hypothetical protein
MSPREIPPEPTCVACSKPIRPGSFVVSEHGDLFHLGCRSGNVQLRSVEEVDRAARAPGAQQAPPQGHGPPEGRSTSQA